MLTLKLFLINCGLLIVIAFIVAKLRGFFLFHNEYKLELVRHTLGTQILELKAKIEILEEKGRTVDALNAIARVKEHRRLNSGNPDILNMRQCVREQGFHLHQGLNDLWRKEGYPYEIWVRP